MTEPRHMDQGESKPRKIDESLKYGKRKKTDEERFECQRYERSDKDKSFWKALRKARKMQ
jgi:hypothetical protein